MIINSFLKIRHFPNMSHTFPNMSQLFFKKKQSGVATLLLWQSLRLRNRGIFSSDKAYRKTPLYNNSAQTGADYSLLSLKSHPFYLFSVILPWSVSESTFSLRWDVHMNIARYVSCCMKCDLQQKTLAMCMEPAITPKSDRKSTRLNSSHSQ